MLVDLLGIQKAAPMAALRAEQSAVQSEEKLADWKAASMVDLSAGLKVVNLVELTVGSMDSRLAEMMAVQKVEQLVDLTGEWWVVMMVEHLAGKLVNSFRALPIETSINS